MSDEYITCRCGAKFTNDDVGKKLYDQHQSWCGKQGLFSSVNDQRSKPISRNRRKRTDT